MSQNSRATYNMNLEKESFYVFVSDIYE